MFKKSNVNRIENEGSLKPNSHELLGVAFQAFDSYDQAVYKWLSDIPRTEGNPKKFVNVIRATPARAFARDISPLSEGRPDLPLISFYPQSIDFAMSRLYGWFPSCVPVEYELLPDGNYAKHFKPLPYDITYNIAIWTKQVWEVQYIDYLLLTRFRPIAMFSVDGNACRVNMVSFSDNSNLENISQDDKMIRHELTVKIEGWLPLPYEIVPSFNRILIELQDITEKEILDFSVNNGKISENL